MERLSRQVADARRAFSAADEDWAKGIDAVRDLADAFESLGRDENMKEAARLLLPISAEIGLQINSKRSAAVRDTCKHMARILAVTGRFFSDVANALMPSVAATAKTSSVATRQPGAELFARMSKLTRYDLQLLKNIYIREKIHDRVCTLLLEQLLIVFVYWSPEEASPYFSDVAAILDGGLNSGSDFVRKAARDAVAAMSSFWPNRVGELRDIPPQQRIQLIYEHPGSVVAAALLEKHPDLDEKVQKFRRRESKNPVRSRVNSRRVSAVSKKGQSGEPSDSREQRHLSLPSAVDQPVSTDRSPDKTLLEGAAENLQTTRSDEPLRPVVEDPAEGHHALASLIHATDQESRAIAGEHGQDANFVAPVPPEFNGSQMYAHTVAGSIAPVLSVEREGPLSHKDRSAKAEPVAPGKIEGDHRSSLRMSSESRIPVPSRSSSIPAPTLRNRPQALAPIPPIEFSGLSGSSEDGANDVETIADANSLVPPLEVEQLGGAESLTVKPIGVKSGSVDEPVESDHPSSPRSNDLDCSGSIPEESDPAESQPSSYPLSDSFYRLSPLPALQPGRIPVDDAENEQQVIADPVEVETWFTPTAATASTDDRADQLLVARGNIAKDTSDPDDSNLLHASCTLDNDAALHPTADDEAKKSPVPQDALLDTVLGRAMKDLPKDQGVNIEDTATQMLQQATIDANALEDIAQAAATTPNAMPQPKGAFERLDDVRQQYADLRTFSKLDVRDFPIRHRPDALTKRDATNNQDNASAVLTEDLCSDGGIRTEHVGPEGLDTKTRRRYRLTRGEASSGANGDGEQIPANPNIPSRGMDARRPRCTIETAQREHSRNRSRDRSRGHSRENSRERRVGAREGGDNAAAAAVSERPLIRKKSIPSLLKGVRLKYEIKPEAPAQVAGDVPDLLENQGNYMIDPAPTTATIPLVHSSDAFLKSTPLDREEIYPTSSLDFDTLAQLSFGAIATPSLQPALEAARFVACDTRTLLQHEPVAIPEPPAVQAAKTIPDTSTVGLSLAPVEVERVQMPRASPYRLVQEDEPPARTVRHRTPTRRTPTPVEAQSRWAILPWNTASTVWLFVAIGLLFGGSGLLRAVTTIRETYEYHHALKLRIDRFEASVAESHETVHKLEKNYAVWSEYVRVLAEEDEANAVAHLEMIQQEVEKWQRDMRADLLDFRRSLSAEGVDAALAPLLQNATQAATTRDGQ